MKLFLAVAMVMTCLLTSARAQSGVDEKYISIYSLIQQGDSLLSAGEPAGALTAYVEAKAQLEQLLKRFPDWNAGIIAFRLKYLEAKISELKPRSVVPTVAVPGKNVNVSTEADVKVQAQLERLQAQVQSAQFENRTLQAKLKEALAAQPATIDATELTQAREQIRWLMKDNDLLKSSRTTTALATAPTPGPDQLIDYVQKYSAEHQRSEKLAAEMAALQQSFSQAPAADATALATLRTANEKLKLQRDSFRAAATNSPIVEKLTTELASARTQIATLTVAGRTVTPEKTALQKQVRQLTDDAKVAADDFGKRIRNLTLERDALLAKLAAADKRISRGNNAAAADTQITTLNDQVKALQARIAVDEAKAVPYTAEELALFRQAPLTTAKPVTDKKPIRGMPAGSAELVASAQRHFANHEFDAAEADYQKILDSNQNNGLVLANLATIELQQGKLAEAEKHIQTAVNQSPDDAYNLSTLGYLKFRQEKYDDALEVLSRAVKIDPQNPEIQNYLGVTLGHKGLRVQAETALRKAIELDGNYAPAHNNLAVIYLNQTPPLPQLARWHYQKALDAGQPHNPDLEKMLAEQGAAVAQ